jgi:hypothetical protein
MATIEDLTVLNVRTINGNTEAFTKWSNSVTFTNNRKNPCSTVSDN